MSKFRPLNPLTGEFYNETTEKEYAAGLLKHLLNLFDSITNMEVFINNLDIGNFEKMVDITISANKYFSGAPEGKFKNELREFSDLVENRLEKLAELEK